MDKPRDYEKDWQEFCLTDGFTEREMKMRGYLRYWMFEYSLAKTEVNRLQVALEAMIEEKERCRKLATDWALKSDGYQMALERCENMKLAREFEELLQTTSIPVAVEKVRNLLSEQWVSVEEKLPEASGHYLCWYQDGFGNKGPWVGYWDESRKGFYPKWPNNPSRNEKYWRYLPESPKEAVK